MIKNLLLAITLLMINQLSIGQDLQWGFEDWEVIQNIENPIGWNVNNQSLGLDSMINRFFKDSIDVVGGKYSMRAEKDSIITSAFLDCTSSAVLHQELTSPLAGNQSVYFYVKTASLNEFMETYVELTVGFSLGNEFLGRVEWKHYDVINDWAEVEVPIPFEGGTAMTIQINAASQNGALDGCNLNSIVWLDDLEIKDSSVNANEDLGLVAIAAFPNPANGWISLNSDDFNGMYYTVTNLYGQRISDGYINNNRVELPHRGFHIIKIHSPSQVISTFKVFNLGE